MPNSASLVIAPVVQPVLRLRFGIAQAFISDATGNVGQGRFRQVSGFQAAEIRNEILQFRIGKTRRVILRHQRSVFTPHFTQCGLVEQVKLPGRINDLEVKGVLVAANTLDFSPVGSPGDNHKRGSTAASSCSGIRAEDLGTQCFGRPRSSRREVRTDDTAATVHFMTV